ncbi:MAG: hypothetical protein Q8P40_01785 [Nitrospirota bacterium]|nr:hypothetical protein [Nitrospirota bacterium]
MKKGLLNSKTGLLSGQMSVANTYIDENVLCQGATPNLFSNAKMLSVFCMLKYSCFWLEGLLAKQLVA